MSNIYLNDADGRKEPTLSSISISDQGENLKKSRDIICRYLLNSDPDKLFFAQNQATHLAYNLSFLKLKNSAFSTVVMSDHEISWIKKMLEISGNNPDNTHSNYHMNEKIVHPTFDVKIFSFRNFEKEIATEQQASIFYISHVSRVSGEISNVNSIFETIKRNNPNSILIIDGSQSIGAMERFDVEKHCDVYLGLSSKFIGAEPHLGFAFMSENFFKKYIEQGLNYPVFDIEKHAKDIYSLWNSLQNPLFKEDFADYIKKLKQYTVGELSLLNDQVLFNPVNQAPNFLTFNFGSVEANKNFVDFASKKGIALSENSGWCLSSPAMPLVRVGLSVRVTKKDVDALVEVVNEYRKKRQSG